MLTLPPQSMRFMGEDDEKFLAIGDRHLDAALKYVIPTSVLDVGCGYGRLAYALNRRAYKGVYTGVDVLKPHIKWLTENFRDPAYSFSVIDIQNDRYNPGGSQDAAGVTLPEVDPDLVLVLSVFTHMYDRDIQAYLRAIRKVAKGVVYMTAFLLGGPRRNDFQITHKLADHCYTADPAEPLHVIGYDEGWLRSEIEAAGFQIRGFTYAYQDAFFLV